MALIDHLAGHYPLLKHTHMTLAALSVGLFSLRTAGVLAGRAWPMRSGVRGMSELIDSLLLVAGATLWWMLALNPARDTWLLVKLMLVVLYIVLGVFALRRAPTRGAKAVALGGAWACIACIVAIALTKDPAAPLRALGLA